VHQHSKFRACICVVLASAGVAAGVSMAGAAFAEDAVASQARRSGVIEQVIVTARKVEESAQDVPVAITALSQELTNSTIRNLTDLNGFAPNVQIGEDGSRGGGGASITIRGISPTRTDDNSFDSPIGVMIDGIYLGSLAGQVLENFDLERIEVLRGPQGTLFGKNTVGGVVHVIRSRPTGELGARVKLALGDDNKQELRFVGNAPIIEDVLAAKVFFTTQQADGYIDNETLGGQVGDVDYENYGATLLLTPNDKFEAQFTIEKFDDTSELNSFHVSANYAPGVVPPPTDVNESNFTGGMLTCLLYGLAPGAPYPQACRNSLATPGKAQNDTDNNAELETDAYTLNMSLELNEHLNLVSVTGYRDQQEYRIFDFDGSAAPWITIERDNDYDQFSQEFRIDGSWDTVKMVSGVYYWSSEFEQDWVTGGDFWGFLGAFGFPVSSPPLRASGSSARPTAMSSRGRLRISGVTPWHHGGIPLGQTVTQVLYETQETTSIAAFAQVDWTFLEDWTATAGLRWTEERKDFKAGQAYLSNVERQWLRNFPEYADLDQTWREVSPKLGITYRINDSSIVYASYSEGFHSGGFFGVNQNTADFVRDQYDPEFAESYEIGYKSTHLDDRLQLNATVFRMDFTDKQEQSIQYDPSTATVATVFDNVADARYQGLELETQFVFTDWFRAFLNYGYLDAEYSDFETDINAGDGETIIEDASFLTPRNAPENTIGVGGTFSWPIGPGVLELYGKYAWVDEIETSLLNTPLGRVDDRKDVTASLGYYAESWSVTAYGRNLTDEEFETQVLLSGGRPPVSSALARSTSRAAMASSSSTTSHRGEWKRVAL
jgi:iron complex outermembrane recepter protein